MPIIKNQPGLKLSHFYLTTLLLLGCSFYLQGQDKEVKPFTARAYWLKLNDPDYRSLKNKQQQGDSLNAAQEKYLEDYELHLEDYFKKMDPGEREKFFQMKDQWDQENEMRPEDVFRNQEPDPDFEWTAKDRAVMGVFGILYGTSIAVLAEIDPPAAIGIPMITGGLWMLGPVLNPNKYEGINRSTLRLSHLGKGVGFMYGMALSAALFGSSDSDIIKPLMGISTAGSIALGEIGFQYQKKNQLTPGQIEMLGHYSILGPWLTLSAYLGAGGENANAIGGSVLAGGIAAIFIGNKVAKSYDFTRGDVISISTLSGITTGLGFAAAINELENGNFSQSVILIPALGTLIGTLYGQKAVKNAYLTNRQASRINLAAAGGALIGLGITLVANTDSPAAFFGIISGSSLVFHQIVFHNEKQKNLRRNLEKLGSINKNNLKLSFNFTPENYLFNKKLKEQNNINVQPDPGLPVAAIKLKF